MSDRKKALRCGIIDCNERRYSDATTTLNTDAKLSNLLQSFLKLSLKN